MSEDYGEKEFNKDLVMSKKEEKDYKKVNRYWTCGETMLMVVLQLQIYLILLKNTEHRPKSNVILILS